MKRNEIKLAVLSFEKLLSDYRSVIENKVINQTYKDCDTQYRKKWQKEYEETEKAIAYTLKLLYESALKN